MPGTRCAVFGCNNSLVVTKKGNEKITYHTFPKSNDLVSTTLRNEWIRRCKRSDQWNPTTSCICSIHFTENDYERDLQHELLGLPIRRKLKKTAVPSLFLPGIKPQTKEAEARIERLMKRREKEEIRHLFDEEEQSNTVSITPDLSMPSTSKNEEETFESKYITLLQDFKNLKEEYNRSIQINKRKSKLLNDKVAYYKKKAMNMSNQKNYGSSQFKDVLQKIFTQNQISIILNKRKWVKWNQEEMANAFTLRYYSKKAYLYLKNNLHYPLPGLSSLKRWALNINITKGVCKTILNYLKLAGENMNNFEKTVVLQFDEVKIKRIYEYDTRNDMVVGPYNYMQVVMARGLFSNWKQPVYLGFDQKMTKDILMEIISELHKITFNVVACVSDCGSSNLGLWAELNINHSETFFHHPQTNNNIYMFADAPHLLKLLRNWLLDKGFQLDKETKIDKTPLEELLKLNSQEINPCYKLTEKHIICEKALRQNVRLAAQLISNTVGCALIRQKPGSDKKKAEDLGKFICIMNSWFDVFNSYCEKGTVPTKNAYGVDIETQNDLLDQVLKIIYNMRPIGRNTLQIFQKGILMSIKSLKSLFNDMTKTFDARYICTHKLNQDSLENFFFQVRSRGPNEHPSPLEAIHRIRMITLGKNPGVLEASTNTTDHSSNLEEYVVAKVFTSANLKLPRNYISETSHSSSTSFGSSASEIMPQDDTAGNEITTDALEYIAGYLIKKHKHVLSAYNVGEHTYKKEEEHSYNLPSWVQQLSYGGLIKPTNEWVNVIKKWNAYFEHIHGKTGIASVPGIVKKMTHKIKKRSQVPVDVIKSFCKLRVIIRINYCNKAEAENKENAKKRNAAETNEIRSKKRKMQKTIN